MQQNMLRDTCLRHSSAAIVDKNDVIHEFHPIQRIKHKQGLMIPTKRHANGFFFFLIYFFWMDSIRCLKFVRGSIGHS